MPARLAQQDDENDSPPTEGTVRQMTDQGWVRVGKAFPKLDPPRPSAVADVHPSDGGDFPGSHP
jgi:hypothetical protein